MNSDTLVVLIHDYELRTSRRRILALGTVRRKHPEASSPRCDRQVRMGCGIGRESLAMGGAGGDCGDFAARSVCGIAWCRFPHGPIAVAVLAHFSRRIPHSLLPATRYARAR